MIYHDQIDRCIRKKQDSFFESNCGFTEPVRHPLLINSLHGFNTFFKLENSIGPYSSVPAQIVNRQSYEVENLWRSIPLFQTWISR